MIFLVLLGELLRCTVAEVEIIGGFDVRDCWHGDSATQHVCCSQERSDCFDEVFTRGRCCPSTCLPLSPLEVGILLEISTGFDAPRLSVAAQPQVCRSLGWQSTYVVVRVEKLAGLPIKDTPASSAVHLKEWNYQYKVKIPVRSLLLCVPESCWTTEDLQKLAAYVTEWTLPGSARQSQLVESKVIVAAPLMALRTVGALPHPDEARVVGEHLGAGNLVVQAAKLAMSNITSGSLVIIDVGTHERSEYMEWLEADSEGRRWVVGFEPDPTPIAIHPAHPRLALLQAAVGSVPLGSGGRTVVLHRSQNGVCNSLFPLRSDPREFAGRMSWDSGCFIASTDGPVEVSVVPLADIITLLPAGQEVALLKVDTQGGDLDVIRSAGEQLQRVRRVQVEVTDLPRGHPDMMYGPSQPTKEDIIEAMTQRGFLLEACGPTVQPLHEENCLFVRNDLLEERPSAEMSVLAAGEFRWDRPGIHFRY